MRLYYSPNSPYARKARIIIHELGLQSGVECLPVKLPADAQFRAINPLGKIPALVLDDNTVIYDSPVVCEYLDVLGRGDFFPRAGEERWRALTLQALGDGLADAVVRRNQERKLPEATRSESVIQHQTSAIESAFRLLDGSCTSFPAQPTIGEVAVCCAIGYLDLRSPQDGWRDRYRQLARWLDGFSRRPSVEATPPPPA